MRKALFVLALVVAVVAGLAVGFSLRSNTQRAVAAPIVRRQGAEVLYISNFAQQYISDAQIRRDIPAWERAVNVDFARYWHSTQFKLVFLGRKPAPSGAMSAEFRNKGPVKGTLAYHWTERGNAPSITVYAGTGDYYGFDNSVSFTHELFELAADPVTSAVNQGYPSDYYYTESKALSIKQFPQLGVVGWFQEVADPVEADSYRGLNGAKISDFVTPAWFNDGVGGRYDFMGLAQQPFWIRPGGYAQYLDFTGWNMVTNFRTGHPADSGFAKGDPDPRA